MAPDECALLVADAREGAGPENYQADCLYLIIAAAEPALK